MAASVRKMTYDEIAREWMRLYLANEEILRKLECGNVRH